MQKVQPQFGAGKGGPRALIVLCRVAHAAMSGEQPDGALGPLCPELSSATSLRSAPAWSLRKKKGAPNGCSSVKLLVSMGWLEQDPV